MGRPWVACQTQFADWSQSWFGCNHGCRPSPVRIENRPPPSDSDAYESWDPCEIAIGPTRDAVAYGHSHPYFRYTYQMNAGKGCGNSRRTAEIDHTDESLRKFNRYSWKFSESDKQWVEAMKKSLYLVGGLRNGVWFYDVDPNGRDSSNGRSVK